MVRNEEDYLKLKKQVQDISIVNPNNIYIEQWKNELRQYDSVVAADRQGDWMPIYTGRRFWLLDPRPEDIDIEDIARGLSNMCRFNGHLRCFYSVAQHSIYASLLSKWEARLAALLHDASEAYCGDVIGPLKPLLRNYKEIEYNIMVAIAKKFDFNLNLYHDYIKDIDERLLATEVRDLVPAQVLNWKVTKSPYNFVIRGWSPEESYHNFIFLFNEIQSHNDHLSVDVMRRMFGVEYEQ